VADDELRSLAEDMRKCVREDTEDLETNQQVTGMRCLFRGFST